jgi:hypothetical protein
VLRLAVPRTATYTAEGVRSPVRSTSADLTAAGVLAGAFVLVAAGTGVDMMTGRGPGLGLALTFLAACAAMAIRLPVRVVGAAVVAAPLLFASATAAIAVVSGDSRGLRHLGLDVATSLALAAPVLFGGTGIALAIALGRMTRAVLRRRR